MRRLIAAGLLALLASRLYRVWDDGSGKGSNTLQQASAQPAATPDNADEKASLPKNETVAPVNGDQRRQPADAEFEALYYNVCPPQSAGQDFTKDPTVELSNSVFIVNGLSSLGARIAHMLSSRDAQRDVVTITSSKDRTCGDQLMWYRQDRLREVGIPSVFIDWSDSTAVGMLLKGRRPSHVIIVPPGIDDESQYKLDSTMWATALHDFVALLEAVKTVSPATRLTLVSVSKGVRNELEAVPPNGGQVSLLETLVGAFELSLSTYHTLYHIPFSVLRLRGLYGPWTHSGLSTKAHEASTAVVNCYIDDIAGIVFLSLSLNLKCVVLDYGSCEGDSSQYALDKVRMAKLTHPDKGRKLTNVWRNKYNAKKSSRVALTSYFTGSGFRIMPNRFQALRSWLESVSNLGLQAVVLHNGLNSDFVARTTKQYSRLRFESTTLTYNFGQNSSCLQSVQAFAHYLEHRTDIERVIVMDLGKTVKRDIFPVMEALGDWLYSDIDIVPFRDIIAQSAGSQGSSQDGDILANSMVLGGSRHMVLATLNKMAACLENGTGPSSLQCVVDRRFVKHAFSGWPLSMGIGS